MKAAPDSPLRSSGERRLTPYLIFVTLFFFALTHYGGITSPDSEVVFRTAESLANRQSFAIRPLEGWSGFGTSKGIDGQYYSIFGPMESILLAPVVRVGEWINGTGWYDRSPYVPLSFYVNDGVIDFLAKRPPSDKGVHALRFIASLFNMLVSCLGVYVFLLIIRKFTSSERVSFFVSIVYALGTLTWQYAGTMFSEPLALLFILLSFYLLLGDSAPHGAGFAAPAAGRLSLSGAMLGCAAATHITAILFVPFFAAYACIAPSGAGSRSSLWNAAAFVAGLAPLLILLGVFNYVRFGNLLETGRSVNADEMTRYRYGRFQPPWEGLFGLTFSWGKGIFLYVPAVILGFLGLKSFFRRYRMLAFVVFAMLAFRLLFLASRSDWHGGYCLGPRYLLMAVPFTLIPFGLWLDEQLRSRSWGAIYLASGLSVFVIILQLAFNLGEVMSFYFFNSIVKRPEDYNQLFFNPEYSPLLYVLGGRRGSFLLHWFPQENAALWLIGAAAIGLMAIIGVLLLKGSAARGDRGDEGDSALESALEASP